MIAIRSSARPGERVVWPVVAIGTLAQLFLCFLVLATDLDEHAWRAYGVFQPQPGVGDVWIPVVIGLVVAALAFPAGWLTHQEAAHMPPSFWTSVYALIAVGWMAISVGLLIAWLGITCMPLVVTPIGGHP